MAFSGGGGGKTALRYQTKSGLLLNIIYIEEPENEAAGLLTNEVTLEKFDVFSSSYPWKLD